MKAELTGVMATLDGSWRSRLPRVSRQCQIFDRAVAPKVTTVPRVCRVRTAPSAKPEATIRGRDFDPTSASLVAGRVGSGIGAVLSNMRATEQIDAIESLSADSFKFLVVPRILACTLALPFLTLFLDFSALLGGFASE